MDEQLRRYYLDQLGIQCWQPVTQQADESPVAEASQPVLTLEQSIAQCTACPLHEQSTPALPGRGAPDADVLVLLMAPSNEDTEAGQICSGEQGDLLGKMLAAIGLSDDQVYITSLLKHSIPERHTITPAEVGACRRYLEEQLASVRPGFILILGELVTRCFFQQDKTLDVFRDEINVDQHAACSRYGDAHVLVSYSPRELLTNPADKRKAWQDLQLLQARLGHS